MRGSGEWSGWEVPPVPPLGQLPQAELLRRAMVTRLLGGASLVELTREVARLFAGPALLIDAQGLPIAASGLEGPHDALADAGIWRGERAALPVPPPEPAALTLASVRFLVAPVTAPAAEPARLLVAERGRQFSAADLPALQVAAEMVALALAREAAVAAVRAEFRGSFARELLDGRVTDLRDALGRAHELGWDLDRPLVTIVAEPASAAGTAVTRAVHARDSGAAVLGLRDQIVVLAGAAPGVDVVAAAQQMAAAVAVAVPAGRWPVTVGVSRASVDLAQLPDRYEQARAAVRIGRSLPGVGAVVHFDDLGVFRLLSLVRDPAELHAFAADTLGRLVGADADEELVKTLQVLLDSNFNVAEAARKLHIHYNTMRYRLEKLERVVGPLAANPHRLLTLQLALYIRQLPHAR